MNMQRASDESEALIERIIRVENALFFRKTMMASAGYTNDAEVQRLEILCEELRTRYEGLYQTTQASTIPRIGSGSVVG